MTEEAEVARFEFRIGDVFRADDRIARHVVRLSMALGDLRIAGAEYAIRPEQPAYERLYFVRLTAAHLHELAVLFNPPDEAIPSVAEFVRGVAPNDRRTRWRLRKAHRKVRRMLQRPLHLGRRTNLASELSRMRNGFFHYHRDAASEPALIDAIAKAADIDSSYWIGERTMRANYADEIANKLMHPWPAQDEKWEKLVRVLHNRIVSLIEPVSDFLHEAEAAWLHSRPEGTVRQKTD